MLKFKASPILILWLGIGLYIGIAGLTRAKLDDKLQELDQNKAALMKDSINISYGGLDFANKYEMKYYLEISNMRKVFPWAADISGFLSLILTSMSFGMLGALISIIRGMLTGTKPLGFRQALLTPALGLLVGLVVLGLSYLLPTILVKTNDEIRPISLMFISLFAGMYSDKFFEKLESYFEKVFL